MQKMATHCFPWSVLLPAFPFSISRGSVWPGRSSRDSIHRHTGTFSMLSLSLVWQSFFWYNDIRSWHSNKKLIPTCDKNTIMHGSDCQSTLRHVHISNNSWYVSLSTCIHITCIHTTCIHITCIHTTCIHTTCILIKLSLTFFLWKCWQHLVSPI